MTVNGYANAVHRLAGGQVAIALPIFRICSHFVL